jgi:hypothetical protein
MPGVCVGQDGHNPGGRYGSLSRRVADLNLKPHTYHYFYS